MTGQPPRSVRTRRRGPKSIAGRQGPFAPVAEAVDAIKNGQMIIIVDDEDRENEGDLTIAADKVTPEAINFMAKFGRGLVCMPMTGERLDELQIPMMVSRNTSRFETAFAVSIEARHVTSTGISASDRAATVRAAVDPATQPSDLARPGHMFPLRARPGGVLVRAGQTEAAVDLARMAGLSEAGVICEIMNDDGTMARVKHLARFAKRHGLLMVTIADLIKYRMCNDRLVKRVASAQLPTDHGPFQVFAYESLIDHETHVALVPGRHRRRGKHSRTRALSLPHRRRISLGPVRLRPPALGCHAAHRRRGSWRAAVSQPGGARHRPQQQDSRLRATGPRL